MIHLFASDLDGTLFNKQHECDEKNEEAIQAITDKGSYFSVATGRGLNMVQLNKASNLSYYICLNGSVIVDPTKRLLHCEPIDKKVLSDFLDAFEDLKIEYVAWNKVYSTSSREVVLQHRKNVWKDMKDDPWVERFINNITKNFVFSQTKEDILKQDICKINYHFEDEKNNDRIDQFLKKYDNYLVNAPSDKGMYEITKKGIDKAFGVRRLANHLKIEEDEVAVYGDSGNDLAMLESFKYSYAPSTASDKAKEKAKYIIGPYDEYSVIKHMLETK